MTTRRIIRPLPATGIELLPAGALAVDGKLDYLDDDASPAPADALYVATNNGKTVIKDTFDPPRMVDKGKKDAAGKPILERTPNTHWHTFAGWLEPGEPVPVEDTPVP